MWSEVKRTMQET